jgi:hypothetical protein
MRAAQKYGNSKPRTIARRRPEDFEQRLISRQDSLDYLPTGNA